LSLVVVTFVAIFLLAAIVVYLFFDPNDFREDIAESVRQQTGRELTIEGDISLDLFPWLAVEIGSTRLGNAEGFGDEPMASFERASLSLRLLPAIFRQQIIIGAADIEALQLNLAVDARGKDNWSDLVPEDSEDSADADDTGGSGGGLDINSVQIVDATITYSDAGSGETIIVDGANLNIGRLTDDGSAVPVDASLNFDMQPNGMSGTVALNAALTFNASAGEIRVDNFLIDGSVDGLASMPTSMRISSDSIAVSTAESTVALQPLDLSLLDMHIVADVEPFSYAGDLNVNAAIVIDEFSPRSVMHLFDVEAPETADPTALSSVSMRADAAVTPAAIKLADLAIKLDASSFTGSLTVPRTAAGYYQFELVGDSIDLNRYMAPAAEGEAAAGEAAPVEIPTDLIAPLKARGKFKLAKATLGNIVFENVEVGVNSNGGKLRIHPVSSDLFGGAYNGDVRIDVAGNVPSLSLNEKIEGVDLAKLAKAMFDQDNVTGTVAGSFVLAGAGSDMTAIQRDLDGNMSLQLKDGTYEGTDIWYELRRARAGLKGEQPPEPELPAKTSFSTATVSGVVSNGVLSSDDLYAELPFMQLTGEGRVNLVDATIDYNMSARVLERPEFLQDATPEELDEFTEAIIPLKVSGPLASPSVKPDVERLLKEKVEEELEDLLKDKLKGLFD
tara:strand:- start:10916 stop:12937 length:2022 start_codon:yes stop_codon:yes gene_type:complete